MNRKNLLSIILLSFAVISLNSFSTENTTTSVESCFEHCIETSRVGASISILWKSANGIPVKVISVDLPKDAVLVSQSESNPKHVYSYNNNTFPNNNGGHSTVTSSTYTTTTEIVTVITTLTFDHLGNLLSVNVHTVTVKLPGDHKMEQ